LLEEATEDVVAAELFRRKGTWMKEEGGLWTRWSGIEGERKGDEEEREGISCSAAVVEGVRRRF